MPNSVLFALLASAAVAAGADLAQAPEPELLAHYQQLRTAGLDPERVAVVENFTFQKDSGTFVLKSGQLCFLQPVAGQVTGAVFTGDGTFTLKPPVEIEKRNLARFTDGKSELEEPFKAAVFLFTDSSTFAELKTSAKPIPPAAADTLKDFRDTFRDDLKTNLAARVLADLVFPGRAMFLADIRGEAHGRLLFSFDPDSREELELIAYNRSLDYFDSWCAYRPGGAAIEPKDIADTIKVKLDTTLDGDKLRGEARIEYIALVDGPRVIPMRLVSRLRVTKAADGDGHELKFIQEDKKKDSDLWVILPAPLKKGQAGVLSLAYAGEDVVQSAGTGNFYVGARTSWYPSIQSGPALTDRAVYEMTFRTPKKYDIVATGRLVSRKEEGKEAISEWVTDNPFPVAGFNYGKYKSKSIREGETEVTVYANPGLVDELAELRLEAERNPGAGISVGGLNTTGMIDRALSEAVNSVRLFNHAFGATPFKTLAVTQQPSSAYGQSWPTLVFLPYIALLDSTMRNQLDLNFGSSKRFLDEVGSHEVAHQWWGHTVGTADYHDEWLSEGFAQYSAGLFMMAAQGDKKFTSFLENERTQILATQPPNRKPHNEAGPIWLGRRLEAKNAEGAYTLVYHKGGYVLHMLRMMLYDFSRRNDSAFFALMHDFVQTYKDKNATTDDFKRICDKHFKEDMSWFFNQWVYGTQIPKVNVKYGITQKGADPYLVMDMSLERVTPDFRVWVPVVLRFKEGTMSGKFKVMGPQHFEVKLPSVPEGVEISPLYSVLGDVEVKKL